jgi:hypothetical protein
MTTIKAHFDGKTIVPDEPVNLPQGTPLFVLVGKKRPLTPEESITGAQLAKSGLVGLWKNRKDIGDSVEYARKLRRQAETRGRSDT